MPRAGELDADAVRCLPPALQFEVLDEIKNAERSRRRDDLVRQQHTAESFSHQQLRNYIEVSKVAGKVDGLRKELAQGRAQGTYARNILLERKFARAIRAAHIMRTSVY